MLKALPAKRPEPSNRGYCEEPPFPCYNRFYEHTEHTAKPLNQKHFFASRQETEKREMHRHPLGGERGKRRGGEPELF